MKIDYKTMPKRTKSFKSGQLDSIEKEKERLFEYFMLREIYWKEKTLCNGERYFPNPAAIALGKLRGSEGGMARAAKLSPARRKEIAKKAAKARWDIYDLLHNSKRDGSS